jgi:anti-sigma-K factor RskA
MTCEQLKDDYEMYSLGLLEGEEKSEIEAHLGRGCEECQKYLKDALAVNALMLSHAPEVVPPSRLKRRVVGSVGAPRAGWTWLAALAAACMAVVALWISVERADTQRTLAQVTADRDKLVQVFNFLNQPETRQVNFGLGETAPPRGNVFVHPKLGVLLIASNLPPLGAGKTYEMWVIPKGGTPRAAGLFRADARGTAMNILSGEIDTSTLGAVAVTVEPEAGSAAPTSQPIIVAPAA